MIQDLRTVLRRSCQFDPIGFLAPSCFDSKFEQRFFDSNQNSTILNSVVTTAVAVTTVTVTITTITTIHENISTVTVHEDITLKDPR